MNLRKLYEENADFKGYVDRYCKKYVFGNSITIDEALTHIMVKMAAEYYVNQKIEQKNDNGVTP